MFIEQAMSLSVNHWVFFFFLILLFPLLLVSSEIVSHPSLLNFNFSLSSNFSPSACEYNKDLTPNILFQSFFLFFSKLHRKCFIGAVHISLLSISPQPTTPPPRTLSWNFLLISLRSNGKFFVFILLTPFLNLCDMVDFLLLFEKSLSHGLLRHHTFLVPFNSVS